MPKKKKSKIPSPQTNQSGGKTIVEIQHPKAQKPEISITYLEISTGEYSLKSFFKKCKDNPELYKELESFIRNAKEYDSIQTLLDRHCPKNGLKTNDKRCRKKMNEIKLPHSTL